MKKFNVKSEYLEVKPEQSGLPFSIFIETAESRKRVDKSSLKNPKVSKLRKTKKRKK